MMTATEQLEWGLRQAEKGKEFASIARSKQNWERMQLNQVYAFRDYFMCVLLAWRMRVDQSEGLATRCIDFAEEVIQSPLTEVPPDKKLNGNFPYEQANLLLLVHRTHRRHRSLFDTDYGNLGTVGDRHLMTLIVERLASRPLSASWPDTLAALAKNKRAKLAVETYQTYDSIINAAESGDMDLARLHAKHAAELFLKRAKDKYYEGGPASEGGGPANEFVVDYALAAIQRRYFSSPAPGAEIHWWHWS